MTQLHTPHRPERLRLPRWVRLWVYLCGGTCAASGAAWLLLHHFGQVPSEFGPAPHPLEHPALLTHGVSGLAMLWVFGLIWLPHIRRGWARRVQRGVGGTMAAVMLWLAITSVGLYYLGDDALRNATAVAHWTVGLVGVVWLPLHILTGRRRLNPRKA